MVVTGRVVVVTGTGTEVGKTIVTAALAAGYTHRGLRVAAVKPAQTGVGPNDPGDLGIVRALTGITTCLTPVRLPDPLAPDTAARRARLPLPPVSDTAARVVQLTDTHDIVVVEGAGGLLVRLDQRGGTIADLAREVHAAGVTIAIVVVVAAGLGTLNHTELTIEALRARDLEPAALIIGSWPTNPGLAERCNLHDLPRAGVPLLGALPAGASALTAAKFQAAAVRWLPVLP